MTRTNNEIQYQHEMSKRVSDYIITVDGFLHDVKCAEQLDDFEDALNCIETENDLFDVALDWSIPVIMVKYLKIMLDF